MSIERLPMITGEDANITCILKPNVPLEDAVDLSIFGAKPSDSLRSTLERLDRAVESRVIEQVRWFLATGPRARWEIACVPIRSAGEGACVWQMNAYPIDAPGHDLLHRDLVQVVRRETERIGGPGSISLSVEPSKSGLAATPLFRARYAGDTLKVLEWVDESIPRDFVLPATIHRRSP